MLDSGTQIGRYVVLDLLGEGATGHVYRAWDNGLDRVVALKLLLPLRVKSPPARKRFSREARLAARINHPSVAHIYDIGEYEGAPFIALEFVPGRQLRAELGAPMALDRVIMLVTQVLRGLSEAHQQGVVHRDLKPENIMISGHDQIKLLDFGLAKPIFDDLKETNDLSTKGLTGTPRYMAPEQIRGHKIDPRTDIYALGTVMYEMMSGQPCHTGKTLTDLLVCVVHKPAPRLPEDICPPLVADIVQRALEKRPQDRFSDTDTMLAQLSKSVSSPPRPPREGSSADIHIPHPKAVAYAQRAREALTGISSANSLALDMLQQAIAIDPKHALSHALYAEACAALFNTGHRDATWFDKAQKALETAEALDPNLPDVRVARARVVWTKTFNFPAETALRELRMALRTNPNHLGALRLWATITAHVGLLDHAEAAVIRRLEKDPHDDVMRLIGASIYIADGNPSRAECITSEVTRLDPNHDEPVYWWVHAHALTMLGRLDEADQEMHANLQRHPKEPLSWALGSVIRALQGDANRARKYIKTAENHLMSEVHPHHAFHLMAGAESILGHVDAALHWLGRTSDEGMPCWPWFSQDPLLENLRKSEPGIAFMNELQRRHEFFLREFPLQDPQVNFVDTEVAGVTNFEEPDTVR